MTQFKILINSRRNLERDESTTEVDKLDKYDKCIKKLRREILKKISRNRAIKKVKTFF